MQKNDFIEKYDFGTSNIEYKFLPRYNGTNIDGYKNSVIKQLYDILDFYHVNTSEHISTARANVDDQMNVSIELDLKFGRDSKSHIRSKIGVLQKLDATPKNLPVHGKVERYDNFKIYNIDDEIREDYPGIYLFSVLVEDTRPGIEFSHAIMKLESISDTNWNSIAYAKENGALHYAFYPSNSETERQRIISDIKEGENYIYQRSIYPELTIPDIIDPTS